MNRNVGLVARVAEAVFSRFNQIMNENVNYLQLNKSGYY